ncbi:MAG: cation-efflux pump [Anaerolineae bacterium]|jgi:cation diffusion facilitator family transporter|nr:cation-efflux pump [Anaerolineae bacterium]
MASHGEGNSEAEREKRGAALNSVIAAVFLTLFKLVVGIMTGSLGILAEVAHSGLDLVAAVVTLVAVRLSGRPADEEHLYGHGKIENLSALFETLLLLGTCAWIIYEAVRRLLSDEVHVEVNIWAFVVMGVAIAVDWSRSRMLYRTAKKYDSQALEADALHFSTDIWSSAVVIVGLGFVWLSERLGIPGLAKADAIAALIVAGIVVYVSLQLGTRTVAALIDGVPASLREEVAHAVRVPGVLDVRQVRVRRSGPESFADVRLTVARDTPLERTHEIATAAERAVREILPGADVVVQVDPVRSDHEGVLTSVRMLAAQHGLGAHGVRIYDLQSGGHLLELHLEVSDTLTVEEAHRQATAFEEALRKTLPAIDQVTTHIEPTSDGLIRKEASGADEARVREVLAELEAENGLGCHPHEVTVRKIGGELQVTFHCAMDAELPITEAHTLTERVESELRNRVANLGRVVIHVEPPNGERAA